ncbi:MAG: hypothetical protein ACP5LJ_06220 [Candidatus Bipolaricaulaceae bacterium]
MRKLLAKERVGSKVQKLPDVAKTPFQRVLAPPKVEEAKEKLRELYRTLSPVGLRLRIEKDLEQLRRLYE